MLRTPIKNLETICRYVLCNDYNLLGSYMHYCIFMMCVYVWVCWLGVHSYSKWRVEHLSTICRVLWVSL